MRTRSELMEEYDKYMEEYGLQFDRPKKLMLEVLIDIRYLLFCLLQRRDIRHPLREEP